MAHDEVEDGVGRRAAVGLRVDLPARVRRMKKKPGAQVGEESAAVGPVVAVEGGHRLHGGERFGQERGVAAVGVRDVGPEASAVFAQPEFRGLLGHGLPSAAEKLSGSAVELRRAAARRGCEEALHGASRP